MAHFVKVPPERLSAQALTALLEEYASRDGTDYGARELSLEEKVSNLRALLAADELALVYDSDSAQWDLLRAQALLQLGLEADL